MGVESLGLDVSLAVEAESAFAAMLGGVLLNALLRLGRGGKDKQLAIGQNAVNVEQEEFYFFGAEFGHCGDSSIRASRRLLASSRELDESFELARGGAGIERLRS